MDSSSRALPAALAIVILAMAGAFGVYYAGTSATLSSQGQSISGLESSVSSLASHPVTSTSTTVSTITSTSTSVSTSTSTSTSTRVSTQTETSTSVWTTTTAITMTTTTFPGIPWNYFVFLALADEYCSAVCIGPYSLAVHLVCPSPTGTATQTCSFTGYSSAADSNYTYVATYPEFNQTNEAAPDNCGWEAYWLPSHTLVTSGQGFGFCIPIGSNGLVVAIQESHPVPAPPPA